MSGRQNSRDRRRASRNKTKFFVRFRVTDLSSGTPLMIEKKAEVVDLSEQGFGILTDYPLQKGHVITLTDKNGLSVLPDYGIVQWTERKESLFRVGLIYNKNIRR